jgi:hypothetical protein
VLTRKGWQRVLSSGLTNPDANVYRVSFSNGNTLTGTAEHPIFIQSKGFINLDTCRYGDIIYVCEKLSYTTAKSSTGILTQNTWLTNVTSKAMMGVKGFFSIVKSGLTRMVQFLKDLTSTIKTIIIQITTLKILFAYLPNNIIVSTPSQMNRRKSAESGLVELAHSLKHGTVQKQDGSGIENTLKPVLTPSHQRKRFAINAGNRSLIPVHCRKIDSVPISANQHGAENQGLIMKPESASSALGNSKLTNTQKANVVQKHVLENKQGEPIHDPTCETVWVDSVVSCKKKQPVYNLTIDAVPEYFANGIRVHNCMDARRYGVVGKLLTVGHNPLHIG